jgi:hypothetical protein
MFDTGMLYPEISNVARAGNEVRLFVYGSGAVQEWSSQGDTWTAGATYAPADFGLGQVVSFQLAPDGLRAIIYGVMPPMMTAQMFYVDRPTLGARFGVAHTIELPLVLDAFMTADCTRVYFSGLDRIFYVDRR